MPRSDPTPMTDRIRMNDFRAEPPELTLAQIKAAERVIRSGWYILGEEGRRFEERFAAWAGLPRVAGVGNGMDALEVGLRASGIGPGDEVITTSMTAFATVLAIIRAGAQPILADINPENAILEMGSVERCLSPRTKAVLIVHLYGRAEELDSWAQFCREHRIVLIEDCAQSHGARWNEKPAGSFGLFSAFSFYPTKNLGALGDAGAVASSTPEMDEKVRCIRNYGQTSRYHHDEIGCNSRLDELQAAILSERLRWTDGFIARRRRIAAQYDAGISNTRVRLLAAPKMPENHVYHLYVVTCRERERLSSFLGDRGIETLIHYPIPIHGQKPTMGCRKDPKGLPATEEHARTCLSIPCHPQMSDKDVARVVATINAFS